MAASTQKLLRDVLRLTPGEAKARVVAARNLAQRRSLTGVVLPALFGAVAAAQAEGVISASHARVIIDAHDALPGAVQAEHGEDLVQLLVTHAAELDPNALATVARHAHDVFNPDGIFTETADHQRDRGWTLAKRRDGSYDLGGRLTSTCGAEWEATIDALAAPRPAVDGTPDHRTPAQRNHDAFADIPKLLMRAEVLPTTSGLTTTLLVTLTAEQFESGSGYVATTHGGLIPTADIHVAMAEGQVMSVLLDPTGGVLSYGRRQRLAPPDLRCAIYARDHGCTFPGCDQPASWCQVHHLLAWADGGETDIDNLALLCTYHHREFALRGWTGLMLDGVPNWVPPRWIDPAGTPRTNTTQHLKRLLDELPAIADT
jgi:hypothetical protein